MSKDKQGPSFPPCMLRRNPAGVKGGGGSYKLRVRVRRAPHLTPKQHELGLGTDDYETARRKAARILRQLEARGLLAGWNGERIREALRGEQLSPQKRACPDSPHELKQGRFPSPDA